MVTLYDSSVLASSSRTRRFSSALNKAELLLLSELIALFTDDLKRVKANCYKF